MPKPKAKKLEHRDRGAGEGVAGKIAVQTLNGLKGRAEEQGVVSFVIEMGRFCHRTGSLLS